MLFGGSACFPPCPPAKGGLDRPGGGTRDPKKEILTFLPKMHFGSGSATVWVPPPRPEEGFDPPPACPYIKPCLSPIFSLLTRRPPQSLPVGHLFQGRVPKWWGNSLHCAEALACEALPVVGLSVGAASKGWASRKVPVSIRANRRNTVVLRFNFIYGNIQILSIIY